MAWKDPFYVVTKLFTDLLNARLHPNTGAPDYNVQHDHAVDLLNVGINTHAAVDTHIAANQANSHGGNQTLKKADSPTFANLTLSYSAAVLTYGSGGPTSALYIKGTSFGMSEFVLGNTTFSNLMHLLLAATSAVWYTTGSLIFASNTGNVGFSVLSPGMVLEFTAPTINFTVVTPNTDLPMNFKGTTHSGLITWMEDEDYFDFADTIKLSGGIMSSDGSPGMSDTRVFLDGDGLTINTVIIKNGLITSWTQV